MKLRLKNNVFVSAFTPFYKNGKVNYDVIPELAQYYNDKNLKVIYVTGYFGEASSLSLRERKRLVKAWAKQSVCFGFDLVVEIGLLPFLDTLELARYCSKFSVSAITAFGEVVYQATTLDEALEDLQRICDAACDIPLLSHLLTFVTQNVDIEEIFRGAMGGRVSCFEGVLTTVSEFLSIKSSVDSVAGYQLWSNELDSIGATFKLGMNATETTNLFPELVFKIRDAVDNCDLDLATYLQQELDRRIYVITNPFGGIQVKTSRNYFEQQIAVFQFLSGIDIGYRYPLKKPNSTVIAEILSYLQSLGVPLYSYDSN